MTLTPDATDELPPRRFAAVDGWLAAGLFAVVFAVYIRSKSYDFIYWDDQLYVANNAFVRAGLSWAGIKYAFTHSVVNNWHPLTMIVSEALSSVFGPSAGTFHAANTVLHAASVGLLFALLRLATGRRGPSLAAAALWGLHPLRVESVAWVAELKDELAVLTTLLTLLAYGWYAARRGVGRYLAVLGLFALSG